MTDPSQILNEAVDLAPVAEVAVGLIAKIIAMVEQAKEAKQEQHDAIVARLKAADDSLATAADAAHQALEDELAKDKPGA
jgi:hypothetical protein